MIQGGIETIMPQDETDEQAVVALEEVSKHFTHRTTGSTVRAIENINLSLMPGEIVSVVGASGCGKSTILNLIAGFEAPTSGSLALDGNNIERPGPERGVVFQDHGLFPWLSVGDNVRFGPQATGTKVTDDMVLDYLSIVGVERFSESFPHELSGGMRQRVALARTLINSPRILLMDEPFGALDALTRLKMQDMVLDLMNQRPMTVLFITHDIEEALLLGDRVIVMSPGPGSIQREFIMEHPVPRDRSVTESNEFLERRREIASLLTG